MRNDAGSRAEHHEIFQRDTAAQPALRHDDAMTADDTVVADLAKITDLGPFADDGVADSAAVDARPRSDLDIVMNDDPPDLRNFRVTLRAQQIAKPVLPDIASGVNDDPVADTGVGDRAVAPDRAIGSDLYAGPITVWVPISVPAPVLAAGPITANGSTVTLPASSAEGCTMAPGETPKVANAEVGRRAPP